MGSSFGRTHYYFRHVRKFCQPVGRLSPTRKSRVPPPPHAAGRYCIRIFIISIAAAATGVPGPKIAAAPSLYNCS